MQEIDNTWAEIIRINNKCCHDERDDNTAVAPALALSIRKRETSEEEKTPSQGEGVIGRNRRGSTQTPRQAPSRSKA